MLQTTSDHNNSFGPQFFSQYIEMDKRKLQMDRSIEKSRPKSREKIIQTSLQSLKLVFPCKKLRRSTRLEIREKSETKTKTIQDGPIGYLEILPLELKFFIFTYLAVEDLSMLTISSKQMRNLVELYRGTTWSQQYILPQPINHQLVPSADQEYYCAQFQRLGVLMKRSTCLYTTKDRLRLIQQFLQKYLCNFHKSCEDPMKCMALVCYGKFLHTVIAGWDEKECTKVYESIGENTNMMKNLNSLVKLKPGAYPGLEMHVRLFYRRVLLDQCVSTSDKAFWLSLILKPFPMVHQARVLFMLFGPMCGEEIQWHEMSESTPLTKEHALVCFRDLSSAFRILHHYSDEWTEDDVISVMDEVTSCPEEWLSENLAHLLFLCGDCIVIKVLNSKAINGRITDLATIITSLCLVCIRHESPTSWVMGVIQGVLAVMESSKDQVSLLYSIIDVFKDYVLDLHEYGDIDDNGQDLEQMLEAQAKFTKEIVLLAFRNNISAS